jgi:hypothetical protein
MCTCFFGNVVILEAAELFLEDSMYLTSNISRMFLLRRILYPFISTCNNSFQLFMSSEPVENLPICKI